MRLSEWGDFFKRQKLVAFCVLFALASFVSTVALIVLTVIAIDTNAAGVSAFLSLTNNFTSRVEGVFNQSSLELEVVAGFLTVVDAIDNNLFITFLHQVPGVLDNNTMFWASVVLEEDVAAHVAAIRAEVSLCSRAQ